jgi:hypothetical protein
LIFSMALRLTLAWILALVVFPAFAADVDGFRVWTDPEKTRAVLDLDSRTDYQLFTLDNPPRVVIDLKKSSLDAKLHFAGPDRKLRFPPGCGSFLEEPCRQQTGENPASHAAIG